MNMKLLNLSIILAASLVASASSLLAMEQGDELVTQLRSLSLKDAKKEDTTSTIQSALPAFPINEYGDDIDPQSYFISGKNLKNLLLDRPKTSDSNEPKNRMVYLGYGVSATNLRKDLYKNLLDNDIFDVLWDQDSWNIKGNIPQSGESFSVEIDQDYAP